MAIRVKSASRDALIKYLDTVTDPVLRELIQLRLQYSGIATTRGTFLSALNGKSRIYPIILPTQASGRWSYLQPALSGFPKKCINPECPKYSHEKSRECWSVADCLLPDKGTFWIEHDLDAVEHRIYALILGWKERLLELSNGVDTHTPVACKLFNLPLPSNIINPHSSKEDIEWRGLVQWQGKDDSRRTIGKNVTYGSQYVYVTLSAVKARKPYRNFNGLKYNPNFVFSIPNIQSHLIVDSEGCSTVPDYIDIAIKFIEDNVDIQKRKAEWMAKIRKDKISRTLYGGPRKFYFSDEHTAKEGFNHIIQGTVASYINESCILLQREFPDSYIIHNKHDSLKWAFMYSELDRELEERQILERVKRITQRDLVYNDNTIKLTATYKVISNLE